MATMTICVYFSNKKMETFNRYGTLAQCFAGLVDHIDAELSWQFPEGTTVTKVTTQWEPTQS